MKNKKEFVSLFLCYLIWGFQPLYFALCGTVDSYMILGWRIVAAAVFSVLLLLVSRRLPELGRVFRDKNTMKFLLPAVVFLLLDWGVFLVAVNAGHILDASIGYYINPLLLFAAGVVIYKEKCTKIQLVSLGVAAVGVIVSTVAYGSFPYVSLIIAFNWAVYAAIKKNVKLDGVVSIAAETLMLTPFALAYLIFFRGNEILLFGGKEVLFLLGSGIVTALPMFLYSDCVARLPLIVMCFAQYLSPTFNLICGFITGETFSKSQLVSFGFFIAAIVIFTVSEIKAVKKEKKLQTGE